jgi:hypothetical protein
MKLLLLMALGVYIGAPQASHSFKEDLTSEKGIIVNAKQHLISGNSFENFSEIAFLDKNEEESKENDVAFSSEAEKLIEEKNKAPY